MRKLKKTMRFSLIELLVVVAIIGILMSMLLPALKKARGKAHEVACANQMKQLWFGFNSYSEDNDEWVLCWRIAIPPGSTTTYFWPYFLKDYLNIPRQSSNLPRTILRCPSENLSLSAASTKFWTPSSYGINGATWKPGESPRFRRPNVKFPSKWSVYMDSTGELSYWGRDNIANPVYQAFRHGKGLNVLFFDGHVEHRLYNSLPTSGSDVLWDGT